MQENQDEYVEEYIRELYKDLNYSTSKFDTQSLTIAGGALGISLTFIKEIVPFNESQYTFLFYGALICFVFTIFLGFIAHYWSSHLIRKTISLAEDGKFSEIKPSRLISIANFLVLLSISAGLILLITYCIVNIEIAKRSNLPIEKKVEIIHELKDGSKLNIEAEIKSLHYLDSSENKTLKIK